MKTIRDILELIARETEMNEGKALEYTFNINLHYMWVSMYETVELSKRKKRKDIFVNMRIDSPAAIQMTY